MDTNNNATGTAVPYAELMVGDSIYIPCRNACFTLAWAGNGIVALEVEDFQIWQIHECEEGVFTVCN